MKIVQSSTKRSAEGDLQDAPASKRWRYAYTDVFQGHLLTSMRIDFQDIITVKVGTDEVAFLAPRDVLCRSSTFFQTALSTEKQWSENRERCVCLPEDDSDVFSIYLQYAFTQRVVAMEEKPEAANLKTYYGKLFALYCFAEKIDDKACKNVIMDRVLHLHQQFKSIGPGVANIYKVFNSTMDDCTLQKYLIDHTIYQNNFRDLKTDDVARCPAFYSKVIVAWAALRNAGVLVKVGLPPANLKKVFYHEAEDSAEPVEDSAETTNGSTKPVEDTTKAAGDSRPAE